MKTSTKFNRFQPLIIIAFWALLFASPLLFGRFEESIDWNHIFTVWFNYLPLLAVFFINRYLLLPKLFFKGKRVSYFISTTTLIGIITLSLFLLHINNTSQKRVPPQERGNVYIHQKQPSEAFLNSEKPPIPPRGTKPDSIPPFANFLILAILLVGFDAGLQISMRWANLEQEKVNLQKEGVENQLAILKNQVSPHFFMNTLNNIHALVDIDSEEAKKAIIKLSKLMRHLLYDSDEEKIPIKKEIQFIESYIELMKLRFSNKVKINVNIPSEIPDKTIPPLLFTSLLENAFKHGISYSKNSFINVELKFSENQLNFKIENSNHAIKNESNQGIGLENTKKRLNLIYKNNYSLLFENSLNLFSATLSVPI